jgi:hypothetical protein
VWEKQGFKLKYHQEVLSKAGALEISTLYVLDYFEEPINKNHKPFFSSASNYLHIKNIELRKTGMSPIRSNSFIF